MSARSIACIGNPENNLKLLVVGAEPGFELFELAGQVLMRGEGFAQLDNARMITMLTSMARSLFRGKECCRMGATSVSGVEPSELPADWAESLGLRGQVVLDKTPEGILVRPCAPANWDAFFANKLTIGSATANQNQDELEVSGDDLLF